MIGPDVLLGRLDRVKQTGSGRWIALCPAHDDGRPSLSVRELNDGRVLVHCFTGCEVAAVLAAVGLEIPDLFPEPVGGYRGRRERDPVNPRDVLFALGDEALLVACGAARLAGGLVLDADERARLLLAAVRIGDACDLFKPHPFAGRRTTMAEVELAEVEHAA
jgi:hypothetical protein